MKFFLMMTVIATVLTSCINNNEYAYNEAVAAFYFQISNEVDDYYKNFEEGDYQTSYEYSADSISSPFTRNRLVKEIGYLKESLTTTVENFEALQPSEKAKTFHQSVESYFSAVNNEFIPAMQAYAACTDSTQKSSLTENIKNVYSRLCELENNMRNVQLEYIKSVGMKPKEE